MHYSMIFRANFPHADVIEERIPAAPFPLLKLGFSSCASQLA